MIKQILIVDDSRLVAGQLEKALQLRLEVANFAVATCHSGQEALEKLEKGGISLLVSDLNLPGISGLDLIARAQEISPDTQVILMTAFGTREIEEHLQRRGAHYLAKPFSLKQFINAVNRLLTEPSGMGETS